MPDDKKSKLFTWFDIERIMKTVASDVPTSEEEILAWLRVYHLAALAFRKVQNRTSSKFGIRPFSPMGQTMWKTISEIIYTYSEIASLFPQSQIQELWDLLEELLVPIPLEAKG